MQPNALFDAAGAVKARTLIRIVDLKPVNNLKEVFRDIRDYFAGNVTGITRDEKIAQNIMRLLFCKIYDERSGKGPAGFANRPNEGLDVFHRRIAGLFEEVKKSRLDIFDRGEKIEIRPAQLSFIVSKLESYSILNADRDVIGDAFEELVGTSFRGGEGQFFTPRNVVQMMIDVLAPQEGERIIDPACGSGGFLAHTLRHFMSNGKKEFFLAGIDKDAFLSKIAKIYLSLLGGGGYRVYCENSLDIPGNWDGGVRDNIKTGTFDVVLTNPPFGAKIPVVGEKLLAQYRLGHRWENGEKRMQTGKLLDKQSPQVLFIERCLQLLRAGGRLGIVLPEGVFGNPSDRYIWEYISGEASVTGVVSLPQETFQPGTHTKTSVLFLKKTAEKPKAIFMAIAGSVGHNKNGKPVYKTDEKTRTTVPDDDLPAIAGRFNAAGGKGGASGDRLGFRISRKDLRDHIFIPEYYNPETRKALRLLEAGGKYSLVSVGELMDKGILQVRRGNEIGSQFYGTGCVPFVRTTDIVNWEIKVDPVKAVSGEVYNRYKRAQDVREGDILFVNDGTFLIGRTAMVTKLDLTIVIQSHLRKIRVLDREFIDPFYLFYLLNNKIVRRQIESKTFVQATISTIGNRLREVILPINNDGDEIKRVAGEIRGIMERKTELRERAMKIVDASV